LNTPAHFKQFNCKEAGDQDLYVLQFYIPKSIITAEALTSMHNLQGEAVRLTVTLAEQAAYEEIMEALKGKRVEPALDFTSDPAEPEDSGTPPCNCGEPTCLGQCGEPPVPAALDESDDTSEVVTKAPDGTIVAIAAAEIDNALYDALYRHPGYDQRWRSLILQGATDQEIGILAFRSLNSGDAHTDEELAAIEPQFWLDGECVLAGQELVRNIRELLGVPEPDEPCAPGMIDRVDYTDSAGIIYRISQGLNSGMEGASWFTVRAKPGSDTESRVKSNNLPDRKDWQLAQNDLDIYAVTHGLTKAAIGSNDDVDTPADVAHQDAQAAAHREAEVERTDPGPAAVEPEPVPEALRLSDTIQAGDEIIRREEKRIPGIEAKPATVVKVDRENYRITTRAGFVSFDALDEGYRLHKVGSRSPGTQQSKQELAPAPVSVPITEAEFDPYAVEAVLAD